MTVARSDRVRARSLALREPGVLLKALQEAWRRWDRRAAPPVSVRIVQTNYRPRSRTRMLVEAVVPRPRGGTRRQFMYLQVYRTKRIARRRATDALGRRPLACAGPPLIYLHEYRAVIWALPNGPRLRAARIGFGPKRFHRFLKRCGVVDGPPPADVVAPDLVRYVPRNRALFRHDDAGGRAVFVKVFAPGDDARLVRHLAAVNEARRSGAIGFAVPDMLAHEPRRRAVVMDLVAGTPVTAALGAGDERLCAAIGRAIAELHGAAIVAEDTWTIEAQLEGLGDVLEELRTARPDLAGAIDGIEQELRKRASVLPAAEPRPIHGNLFGDQILADGERIGIVDWDDLRCGDPAYDVGRLLAHALFEADRLGRAEDGARACASLLGAYAAARPGAIGVDRLCWHVAACRLERAKISALRPLAPTWIDDVDRAVAAAQAILRRPPGWMESVTTAVATGGEERCV